MNRNHRVPQIALATLFSIVPSFTLAAKSTSDSTLVPFTDLLYGIGDHMLGSATYRYGLPTIAGAAFSYGLVESETDWKWRRNALEHPWISRTGQISVETGPIVSVGVPLGLYLFGRYEHDAGMQITGLALGQAAINAGIITTVLKAFTGRVGPQHKSLTTDYSEDFRFGFLRGGVYQGWPSTHTAIAFSMATTLMELYPGNTAVAIGGLTYASLIGIGVSTNIHWLSDVVAGAFIGSAIGISTGTGFRVLMNRTNDGQAFTFSVTPTGVTFTYRF